MTIQLNPLSLGVYFDGDLTSGGAFRQCIRAINKIREVNLIDCNIKYIVSNSKSYDLLFKMGISSVVLKNTFWMRLKYLFLKKLSHPRLIPLVKLIGLCNPYDDFFCKNCIDLVYFTGPFNLASYLGSTNYIFTVWDLAHRENPEFPEVRDFFEFERRENFYRLVLGRSTAVLVESETGKKNVIAFYGVNPERVFIIPLSTFDGRINSDPVGSESGSRQIDGGYIYYPAQFWAHKNHAYILRALSLLNATHGLKLKVIFSGADKGNFKFIKRLALLLNVEKYVIFSGFIRDDEVLSLYKGALALVMPTYFGPTNLPPVEAFSLGVPVIYSVKLCNEFDIGRAVCPIDLNDPNSLVKAILKIRNDSHYRLELIRHGFLVSSKLSSQNPYHVLSIILRDFRARLSSWKFVT